MHNIYYTSIKAETNSINTKAWIQFEYYFNNYLIKIIKKQIVYFDKLNYKEINYVFW